MSILDVKVSQSQPFQAATASDKWQISIGDVDTGVAVAKWNDFQLLQAQTAVVEQQTQQRLSNR